MRRSNGLPLTAVCAFACAGPVQAGYPPLVTGCQKAGDCAFAGPGFTCVDGGCTVATCHCDADCGPGLGCELVGSTLGECVSGGPLFPCAATDGGLPTDGGSDAGPPDGGGSDAGREGGGLDAGDGGQEDGGPRDAGTADAGLDGGRDGGPARDGGRDGG